MRNAWFSAVPLPASRTAPSGRVKVSSCHWKIGKRSRRGAKHRIVLGLACERHLLPAEFGRGAEQIVGAIGAGEKLAAEADAEHGAVRCRRSRASGEAAAGYRDRPRRRAHSGRRQGRQARRGQRRFPATDRRDARCGCRVPRRLPASAVPTWPRPVLSKFWTTKTRIVPPRDIGRRTDIMHPRQQEESIAYATAEPGRPVRRHPRRGGARPVHRQPGHHP